MQLKSEPQYTTQTVYDRQTLVPNYYRTFKKALYEDLWYTHTHNIYKTFYKSHTGYYKRWDGNPFYATCPIGLWDFQFTPGTKLYDCYTTDPIDPYGDAARNGAYWYQSHWDNTSSELYDSYQEDHCCTRTYVGDQIWDGYSTTSCSTSMAYQTSCTNQSYYNTTTSSTPCGTSEANCTSRQVQVISGYVLVPTPLCVNPT